MRDRVGPVILASLLFILPTGGISADIIPRGYLEAHCFDCHDASKKKGGLDLEALSTQLDTKERFGEWALVHDRIAAGEMPPKSRRTRPSEKENSEALKQLDDALHEADAARIARTGRSLFRRLSAQEYENALQDLLYLPGLRIKSMLPEDERRHGYDKVGQALDLSNVHLSQFMDAADLALTRAIATRSTPPTILRKRYGAATGSETWGWVARGDAVLLKDKQFDPFLPMPAPTDDLRNDDSVKPRRQQLGYRLLDYPHTVGFFSGPYERTFSTSLQFSPVHAGKYRIRASAWGFWWDRGAVSKPHRNESFMLSVWLPSDGPRFIHSPLRRLGMFDVPTLESRVHEYTGWFDVNEELLFEMGTPTGYEKNNGRWVSHFTGSCAVHSGPGIALDWFEVEGPIFEQWPPRSHTAIFGDLPIRPLANVNGMIAPKREPVRQRSRTNAARPKTSELGEDEKEPPLESVFSEHPQSDATRLLAQFLPRAFRRAVPADEVQGFVQIVTQEMGRHACFEDAMKQAYKTALCSPDFLFIGDASLADKNATRTRLSDRALAERLALWFWNSVPDAELLALANEDRLHLPGNLKKQTDRLLADARSERFITDFTDQWLDLRKIDASQPDARIYPEAREHLKHSMLAETRAYFRELITRDLSTTYVVKSDFAMLNQSLADHYGVPGVIGCDIRRVSLPADNPRGPFLTQAAVLKVTANGTTTSPVTRGVWINERILGNHIPPPPAGVPTIEPDTRGAKTIREQLEKHRSAPACAGCHAKIDPPGFALESFDVIGGSRDRYRSLTNGNAQVAFQFASGYNPKVRLNKPVDASGQLPTGEPFKDFAGFQSLLSGNREALAENMVRQLLIYSTGSVPHYSDRREIVRILAETKASGHGLRSLIYAIVHSELFLTK